MRFRAVDARIENRFRTRTCASLKKTSNQEGVLIPAAPSITLKDRHVARPFVLCRAASIIFDQFRFVHAAKS